jgi:hypothetical protein
MLTYAVWYLIELIKILILFYVFSSLVRIIIEDQNDVSPVFTNKTYTYSLRENELPGSRFGYVSAFDKDTNSILSFGCTDGAQGCKYEQNYLYITRKNIRKYS